MKKDKEWLKAEVNRILRDKMPVGINYYDSMNLKNSLNELINQLDEPEVLSQKWIDNNSINASHDGVTDEYVHVDDLENLIVPKQELPIIPKFAAEWIEKAKETEYPLSYAINQTSGGLGKWLHTYHQNVDIRKNQELFTRAWLDGYTVEEEQLYYALVNGHELTDSDKVYWVHDKSNGGMFIGILHSPSVYFLSEMSKSEWNELGINDSNANFIKVEEVK